MSAESVRFTDAFLKDFSMNSKNECLKVLNEIYNESKPQWEILTNKYNLYDALLKDREKISLDIVYVQGEAQYIQMKIESNTEQINEIKRLTQERVVKLVELEHEKDNVRDKLVNKNNALKRASKYFRNFLHLYIRVQKEEDMLNARICYFTQKFDDTYSFVISKNDNENKWTLNSIKPKLDNYQFMALQKRFNSSNNMPSLLCTVRKIFMLYTNSRK